MNTMTRIAKKLLGALAFANAGNLNDFRTLLTATERPAERPESTKAVGTPLKLVYVNANRPVTTPAGHLRQAL